MTQYFQYFYRIFIFRCIKDILKVRFRFDKIFICPLFFFSTIQILSIVSNTKNYKNDGFKKSIKSLKSRIFLPVSSETNKNKNSLHLIGQRVLDPRVAIRASRLTGRKKKKKEINKLEGEKIYIYFGKEKLFLRLIDKMMKKSASRLSYFFFLLLFRFSLTKLSWTIFKIIFLIFGVRYVSGCILGFFSFFFLNFFFFVEKKKKSPLKLCSESSSFFKYL